MPSNPSDPDPDPDLDPGGGGGLIALLSRWGFSASGWRDNRHGEWWLAAQLLLLVALLLPPLPPPPLPPPLSLSPPLGLAWSPLLRVGGGALLLLALALAVQALLRLGSSLSPLPEPMPGAPLVAAGAYGRCRHPLYQALLIGALAVTLLLGSLLHLALLLALAAVLGGKARREERALCREHPDYPAYRSTTPAIVPRIPWLDWR